MTEVTDDMLLREKDELARVRPVSNALDRLGFLIAVSAGTAAILVLKIADFDAQYAIAAPLTVMLIYAAIVWRTRRFRLREDQSGDNLYYLGFLFTLVSLAYALFVFDPKVGPETIISNFGIALATTICGLALRVFFNQMRQDPVEIETEARVELSQAATRLRAELDNVVLDMGNFRRATQQSIAEGFSDISSKAAEGIAKSTEQFGTLASTMVGRMDSSYATFSKNAEQLNIFSGQVVVAVETLLKKIERIEAPSDLLSAKLVPALDAIQAASDQIRARMKGEEEEFGRLSRMIEVATGGASALANHVQVLSGAATRAEASIEHMVLSTQQAQQLSDALSSIVDRAAKLNAHYSNTSDIITKGFEATQTQLEAAISSWAAKNNDLSAIGRAETDFLRVVEGALGEAAQSISEHSRQLSLELEKSRGYTSQVHSALVDMTKTIIDRLQ